MPEDPLPEFPSNLNDLIGYAERVTRTVSPNNNLRELAGHGASFQTLVRPTRPLRDFTRELTGLTDDDLADAPLPMQALDDFYDFVGDRPLIAHNGFRYDFVLLDAAAKEANLPNPANARLNSLELAHLVFPRAGNGIVANIDGAQPPRARSLDELARYFFGDEPRDQHRAKFQAD